nr:isoform 4 of rho gtpase-activating protein 8 [Quercus suber]
MRTALAAAAQRRATHRSRSNSLTAVPPAESSDDYIPELAAVAASILYRCPQPSRSGRPVYVLNSAAFPDAYDIDYDSLLSYVLARLPEEDELLSGTEYEVVFFAGGQPDSATNEKRQGPGMGWYLQAYHVLSRATRKRLERLYIVHPRTWVRVLIGVFGTIVSPKFRRKIVHVNTLSQLAQHVQLEKLLIQPATYLHDRKLSPEIEMPYASGRRAFGVRHPFPKNITTGETRLPRVLRETTSFILLPSNIETEGLFRIPPHSVLSGVLKEAYDRGQQYIVWKEKHTTFVQPGMDQALVDEVRQGDAYGVHSAASLIKTWYRELQSPIFPETSYEALRTKYGNPEDVVTPEDLVDIILPQSPSSPLTLNSRLILTRHLLPMLSLVAAHESQNKMSAENLAICFSMTLICGHDQIEDAKISSIVKRILKAAIEMWPQLRTGLTIESSVFDNDIAPPLDPRDYEDPLEDEPYRRILNEETVDGDETHRIVLNDEEDKLTVERAPTLPPRPGSSTISQSPPDLNTTPVQNVTLSARSRASSAAKTIPGLEAAGQIKRKPAPPIPMETQIAILDPPRYSAVFDADGHSLHPDHSPIDPVDGFGPPQGELSRYVESEKKRSTGVSVANPTIVIPKRKAVSGEYPAKEESDSTQEKTSPGATSQLARLAAQRVANSMAQRITPSSTTASPVETEVIQPTNILASSSSTDNSAFRKPSWPASATRQQHLARPVYAHTVPKLQAPSLNPNGTITNLPRHRAPSPGLLKRMESMPVVHTDGASDPPPTNTRNLAPRKLNLRKTSVDDLRRLYEERASTAEGLKAADLVRRGSR